MMARLHASLLALALLAPTGLASPSPNLETGLQLIRSKTRRNLRRGARLVHIAATEGETEAEYVMGVLYAKGQGTDRSPKRAVRWFRRAADKGHVKSQLALGRMLGRSQSPKLRKEAWTWLEKAHVQGAPAAKKLLAKLAEKGVDGAMAQEPEPAEVTVINMGRGEPLSAEEEAAIRERDQRRAEEAAERRKKWAEQATVQATEAAKARQEQAKAAKEAAEAARREAADRAARRAAGLPELPRGQVSPHLRK